MGRSVGGVSVGHHCSVLRSWLYLGILYSRRREWRREARMFQPELLKSERGQLRHGVTRFGEGECRFDAFRCATSLRHRVVLPRPGVDPVTIKIRGRCCVMRVLPVRSSICARSLDSNLRAARIRRSAIPRFAVGSNWRKSYCAGVIAEGLCDEPSSIRQMPGFVKRSRNGSRSAQGE